MKIAAYDVRNDEKNHIESEAEILGIELKCFEESLNMETINTCKDMDGVTILGSHVPCEIIDKLIENNVKVLSTRTIGYNHIDIDYAKKSGLMVCNGYYDPDGVAEYTVMLILMAIRNYKQALFRGNVNDYSLYGLMGKEIKNLTVGIIGTGKIGACVCKKLTGFGCRIIAYDSYKNPVVEDIAEYVSWDKIIAESDVITLHLPLLKETKHIINAKEISKMKKGITIINCARGELMDVNALIEGIENEQIGSLGLDVIEHESGIYHEDKRSDIIKNRNMAYLRQFPNVTMTQHIAFYTDAAVKSMGEGGVRTIFACLTTGKSENRIC